MIFAQVAHFLGNRQNHISWANAQLKEYSNKLLEPFGLNNEHSNSLTTTASTRPPLDRWVNFWGDVNTCQSTSGSLITLLKNNTHCSSKTQQGIATRSAAVSSTISDAVHLKQVITEIEDNIGMKTFDNPKPKRAYSTSLSGFRICIKLAS